MDPLENFRTAVDNASKYLDVSDEIIEQFKVPDRVLEANLTIETKENGIETFKSYRSQFNNLRGPYKGGIRYYPGVGRNDAVALSGWMMIKTAVVDIPFGGGKGEIDIDSKNRSKETLKKVTKEYAKELRPLIGEDKDSPAPDVYTGPREMKWIRNEYERLEGKQEPAVITGKPISNGGSKGRVEATGRSTVIAAREALKLKNKGIKDATVAIQGFGNAGSITARLMDELGATVVAVNDSSGGVYKKDGLHIDLLENHKNENGTVDGFQEGDSISDEDLLTLDVDVLVPAALENAIDENIADDIKADVISEAANGPLTSTAGDILKDKNVVVIPDVLANAGGVVVSYFEWTQNKQGYYWNEKRVNNELEDKIVDSFKDVLKEKRERDTPNLRTAAYTVAIRRLIEAL